MCFALQSSSYHPTPTSTLKRAPRPNLAFCLKPKTNPLWPDTKREVRLRAVGGISNLTARWAVLVATSQAKERER